MLVLLLLLLLNTAWTEHFDALMGKDDLCPDFDDGDAVRQQKREGEEDMLQQYSLVLVVVVRRALLLRKSERKKAFDSLGMKSEEIFTRMH